MFFLSHSSQFFVLTLQEKTMASPLYVDQAATSHPVLFPVNGSVSLGNPSSPHQLGRIAKEALQEARRRIAQAVLLTISSAESLTGQVIVTSGGPEGNNLVLQQPKWRFIVTMATEHHSVFFPAQYMSNQLGCEVVFLSVDQGVFSKWKGYPAVDGQGCVADINELRHTLTGRFARGSGLVSVALANNETGTILDLASIGQIIQEVNQKRPREERVWFHSDAMQAPGPGDIMVNAP